MVRFGDHVLVENPAFPPLLDLLEAVGATVVGVAVDEHGLRARRRCAAALADYEPVARVPAAPRAQPDRREHDRRPAPTSSRRVLAAPPGA